MFDKNGMINDIATAKMTLAEVEQDVRLDAGEEMVEAAWGDLVRNVCEQCTPEVAEELARREGVQL